MATTLKATVLVLFFRFSFFVAAGLDFSGTGFDPKDLESEDNLRALYDGEAAKQDRLRSNPGEKKVRSAILKDKSNLEYIHENKNKITGLQGLDCGFDS
ncbi:hypothetical protein R1flu_007768 [Riccia fluitans]|uniref:Uncharacterized protein n=1 Tax=Riccia fluitans TaxID=41844 RepID=A0ABD1YZS7_9MARC